MSTGLAHTITAGEFVKDGKTYILPPKSDFTVKYGETTTVDLVFVDKNPPQTATVRGRVTLPDGSPAKNFDVDLIDDSDNNYKVFGANTDDQGYYRFSDIPIGDLFRIHGYSHATNSANTSCFTDEDYSRGHFNLTAGQVKIYDFELVESTFLKFKIFENSTNIGIPARVQVKYSGKSYIPLQADNNGNAEECYTSGEQVTIDITASGYQLFQVSEFTSVPGLKTINVPMIKL